MHTIKKDTEDFASKIYTASKGFCSKEIQILFYIDRIFSVSPLPEVVQQENVFLSISKFDEFIWEVSVKSNSIVIPHKRFLSSLTV